MSKIRKIKKVLKSIPTLEGAGVHLKRALGYQHVPQFDPFLLLDDFHSDNPDHYIKGFPWHPHRGIETITYVLNGEVEHGDSMGNRGVIRAGDVQWMTAGSGIIHQEMPKGQKDDLLWGFQLWANLPASHKMMAPRYREILSSQIPKVKLENDVEIAVICGQVKSQQGPVQDIVTDPEYLDISMPPKVTFSHTLPIGHTVMAYVIKGEALFEPSCDPFHYEKEGKNYFDLDRKCTIDTESLILFEDGDEISVSTEEQPVRFLLISGKPIGEPVAWQGPIVMNTREELKIAFEEYHNGTFLKHRS